MMAQSSRFTSSVEDFTEEQHQLLHIPEKTKNTSAWAIRVWTDWTTVHGAVAS